MSLKQHCFTFKPIYQERIWGGRHLQTVFGRLLPSDKLIGESWEVVDRAEAQSIAQEGPFVGMSLKNLLQAHGQSILGPKWPREKPFPLIVKWLDCQAPLSIQVHPHPPAAVAYGGEPKTEYWYFYKTQPQSTILAGFKTRLKQESVAEVLGSAHLVPLLNEFPAKEGEGILIPSGTIHALRAGLLVLEIQQNSDTTYRLYDWERKDASHKKRPLHIEEGLKALDFCAAPLEKPKKAILQTNAFEELVNCPYFRIQAIFLQSGGFYFSQADKDARVLSVLEGALEVEDTINGLKTILKPGAHALLSFAGEFYLSTKEQACFMVTDRFTCL